MDIAAYVPGKSAAPTASSKVYKLSSNENPLGASPAAIEAVRGAAEQLEFYPDGSATSCARRSREVHGLNPANIVCSNGSDELLGLLAQTYLRPATRHFHRARLPGLQDLDPGRRRHAGRREGEARNAPMSMPSWRR